jgi:hypothetical protein
LQFLIIACHRVHCRGVFECVRAALDTVSRLAPPSESWKFEFCGFKLKKGEGHCKPPRRQTRTKKTDEHAVSQAKAEEHDADFNPGDDTP